MSKAAANQNTPTPKSEGPSWDADVELMGIRTNQPISGNGYSSIVVGQAYSSGVSISGIVTSVTLLGRSGGIIRVTIDRGGGRLGYVLVLPGGALSEVADS